MKLSVVIVSYNVRHFLELCILSVQDALATLDSEIIVVDNNSEDDTQNMVTTRFPEVRFLANDLNLGFSKANNQGVAEAKGQYVCILNPDTVVAEDTFTALIDFIETLNNPGIVGCRLIDGSGRFLPESKRNVPVVKVAFNKIFGSGRAYYAGHVEDTEAGAVDVLVGAFMIMDRDLYRAMGGFDEDYFMYGEDIDLSFRVLKGGRQNFYFGKTTVIHFKGESSPKDKQYARRFFKAMTIFYKKHFRRNLLFDLIVNTGIQLVHLFRNPSRIITPEINHHVLVSESMNERLLKVLSQPVDLKGVNDSIPDHTEVILDNNHVKFKDIINYLSTNSLKESVTFKILPRNANYLIGSSDPRHRGEVVFLT